MAENKRSQERDRRRLTLHTMRRGLAIVVLLAVVAGVYLFLQLTDHGPGVQMSPQAMSTPVVSTMVVELETVPMPVRYIGQVEASQVVEIRARVDGFLEERAFEEGTLVEQGQLLYRIDSRSFQAKLDSARAQLAGAQARFEQARLQEARYQTLTAQRAAVATELEEWQTAARVAEAEVRLAEAQIAQAELDLSYTTVNSPIRGLVGESQKDVGTYVSAGANSLLAVVSQLDPIHVRLSVSEEETLRLQAMVQRGEVITPSMEEFDVQVTLPTGEPYPHQGRLNFVDVRVDPLTGTRVFRATVPNPDRLLVPGQSAHATVIGAQRVGAVLVPQQAVLQTPTGSFVYVVRPDQTVEQRTVTLGGWHQGRWAIESGLAAGDRVVIDQLMQLRPGMAVQLGEQAAATRTDADPEQAPRS